MSSPIKVSALFIFIFFAAFKINAQEMPRTILALYDSSEEYNTSSDVNMIHRNAEVVLNWLGLKLRFWDASKGLPSEESMKDIYGILSWYLDDHLSHAAAYCDWLKQQIEQGKKAVILGQFGAQYDTLEKQPIALEKVQGVFKALGLSYQGLQTDSSSQVAVFKKDSSMVEFERTLDREVSFFESVSSVDPRNHVYLELVLHGKPDLHSVAVVTTPHGGFAMHSYVLFRDYRGLQRRWRINPFRFFEEAFQLEHTPRFDTTTLFGNRIFYTHIDGDGFRNLSEFDSERYAGEVIYDDILKVYPVPFTVSFVAAEIDPHYLGSKRFLTTARKIWNLENVEAGSHEFSHPLDWAHQLVSFPIKGYAQINFLNAKSKEEGILEGTPYRNAALVKAPQEVFLKREIQGAADYLNDAILPKGKKVVMNQWSGNCMPPEKAIALCRQIGMKNINGGDSRFDPFEPSYTGLASLTRTVGEERQFHTSNANENIYTDLWSGSFYAFQNVIETFKQTEIPTLVDSVPRRMTPINIYYHFYSGERKESLRALKKVYDYALSQSIIPLYVSEYVSIAEGFFDARYETLSDGGLRFSNFGACRTVRFDNEKRFPDLSKSQGILGFSRWKNYLYVFLQDQSQATLYWTDQAPQTPFLESATSKLENVSLSNHNVRFSSRGFGKTIFEWAGFAPHTEVNIQSGDKHAKQTTDAAGHLKWESDFKEVTEFIITFGKAA